MSLAKKLKMIIKGEPKPTFGTDPNEPWSVRAGITESEVSLLGSYLKSRGINPDFVSKDTKISHAKSTEFSKWKRDHMFDDPADTVSSVAREKMKSQREEVELDETMTLKHTPTELRQHILNRQKHMTKVLTHNGLHKEETDKTDTITVDIPLMIRLLEYAREDAKTDMDLHKVTERLIEIRSKGMLTMDDYDFIVGEKKKIKEQTDTSEKNEMAQTQLHFIKYASEEILEFIEAGGKIEEWYQNKLSKVQGEMEGLHSYVEGESRRVGIKEAKTIQGTALDKFRQAAAERAKKHADIEKQSKEKPDMKGAIDRLEKHLNKEETEQIDEISKSTLASYKDKSTASLKNAQVNRDAAEAGKHMSKGFADLHAKSDAVAKKRVKGLIGYMQRKQGMKPMGEDVYQDSQAATQTAFDMGTTPNQTELTYSKKKAMSKSARMIKALYKHNNMKEEIYDHEKEDKSVATYGKKPKAEKIEANGNENNQASMVLKGGRTLTGQTRDTLEIDPVMRKPASPDNKNSSKKTDK